MIDANLAHQHGHGYRVEGADFLELCIVTSPFVILLAHHAAGGKSGNRDDKAVLIQI